MEPIQNDLNSGKYTQAKGNSNIEKDNKIKNEHKKILYY